MVGIFLAGVSSIIGFVEVMPQTQSGCSAPRAFVPEIYPDGTLITDEKGRIIYANAAYGRLTAQP